MILLRTTHFSPTTSAFANCLQRESPHQVTILIDESRGPIATAPFDKISLNRQSCESAGLYCPPDFAWRCGDYGLYLAHQRYGNVGPIWQIEYDVRISGRSILDFFAVFNPAPEVDLIVGNLRLADDHWFWTHSMAARNQPVWRCLLPVMRLSDRALRLLYETRLAHSRSAIKRASWPNDESFIASVLQRNGMVCRDINDFGVQLYSPDTFSFEQPFDGSELNERDKPLAIYHPVLFGDDLARKRARMAAIDRGEPLAQKLKRRVIHAINRRLAP